MSSKQMSVFKKRKYTYLAVFGAIAFLYLFSSFITKFNMEEGLIAFPNAAIWMAENLIPDEKAFERLPKIIDKLIETTLLSVAVTVVAAVFAFFFSLFGSKTTSSLRWLLRFRMYGTTAF